MPARPRPRVRADQPASPSHRRPHQVPAVILRTAERPTQVATILDILTRHPTRIDLAFIRTTIGWPHGWVSLAGKPPTFPHVDESDVRINRHLRTQYVPDAYAVQILTDAHLSRARSLAAWDVEEIRPERHLVRVRDLAPWFSGDVPGPDVLAAARQDFGDMIMTPEAIAAYPRR